MANPGVAAGTAAAAGAGGGMNIFIILGMIILVIAVVGGALYIFVIAPSASSGLHGTGSISPDVLAILPPNQTSSFTGVLSGVGHNIAGEQPFSINYRGSAQIGVSLFSYTVPLNVAYEHVNSSSRLTMNLSKVPLFGNLSDIYVRVNSTSTYSCTEFSSFGNLTNSSSQSSARAYQCVQLQGVSSLAQALEKQNSSSSSSSLSGGNSFNTAFNVSMKSYGTRYFNTQPCLFVEGSGRSTSTAAGKALNTSYTLSMCLSGSYSVPLNFTFVGSSGVNATASSHYSVSFYEVSIGAPASQAAVATLPGPIYTG